LVKSFNYQNNKGFFPIVYQYMATLGYSRFLFGFNDIFISFLVRRRLWCNQSYFIG